MKTVIPPARYLLALLLFNLAACSTMQPVALPENGFAPESVIVGSQVELLTMEGALHRFAVTEINEEGVGGEPGYFATRKSKRSRCGWPARARSRWPS